MSDWVRLHHIRGRRWFTNEDPVAVSPRGRVCAEPGCETHLSVYNHGTYCGVHAPEEVGPISVPLSRRKPGTVPPGATKVCTSCHRVFPATTEFFYAMVNGRFGLTAKCKPCHVAYVVERRRHRVNDPQYDGSPKTCSRCGVAKPRTAEYFKRDKSCRDGLRPECRSCSNKGQRDRRVLAVSPRGAMLMEVAP